MAESKYGPGAVSVTPINVGVGVTDLNPRRTLMAIPLQLDGPIRPAVLPDDLSKSLSGVFDYAKPKVQVDIDTGEGKSKKTTIEFKDLASFKPEEIVKRDKVLQTFATQEEAVDKLIQLVRKSKNFRNLLNSEDGNGKEEMVEALKTLLQKLA